MKALLIEWDGTTGKRPDIIEDILDIGVCTVTQGYCLTHNSSVGENTKCPGAGLSATAWKSLWLERIEWRRQALIKPVPDAFFGCNHRKLRTCWQTPTLELCVLEADWDISRFEGNPEITVLHNDAEIQAKVDEICPPSYQIEEETLFKVDLEQRAIKLADIPGGNTSEQLQNLKTQGVKGISEIRRPSLAEMYPPEKRAARGLPE